MAPFRRIAALNAFTRKYFRVASFLRDFIFVFRRGITHRVLSSRPNHIGNQWFEIKTMRVPMIRLRVRNRINVRFMRA